jgi:hypothetical protein
MGAIRRIGSEAMAGIGWSHGGRPRVRLSQWVPPTESLLVLGPTESALTSGESNLSIFTRIAIVFAISFVSGCNLVSQAEIERRIEQAISIGTAVNLSYLDSSIGCIFAIANITPQHAETLTSGHRDIESAGELGFKWWPARSIEDFFSDSNPTPIDHKELPDFGAVLVDSRNCAPDRPSYENYIYSSKGYLSFYSGGDELILITGEKLDVAIYLVAGK